MLKSGKKKVIQDKDELKRLLDYFTASQLWMSNKGIIKTWAEATKLYKQKLELKVPDYQKGPEAATYGYTLVESVVSTLMSIYTQMRPLIKYKLRQTAEGVTEDLINQVNSLVDYWVEDENVGFMEEMDSFFRDLVMYGISYIGVYSEMVYTNNSSRFTAPKFLCIAPTDIFPEPDAVRFDRARWFFRRVYLTVDELKDFEDQGIYKNVEDIENMDQATLDDFNQEVFGRSTSFKDGIGLGIKDGKVKQIELLEFYDGGNTVTTIGARRVILQEEVDLGKCPIISARYSGNQHEYFSIGLLESIEKLQKSLLTLRSQRRYNVSLSLNKLFVANMLAKLNVKSIVSAPGNIIWTNNIDGTIKELPIQDVTSSSYREDQILSEETQRVAGNWNYSRGETPTRRETATAVVKLQEASMGRSEYLVQRLNKTMLYRIGNLLLWMARKNLDQSQYEKIIQGTDVGFFSAIKDADSAIKILKPYTDASIDTMKEVRRNTMLQAFSMVRQSPTIDEYELIKSLLDQLDVKDVNKIMVPKQQYLQMRQMQMQMAQQQMAQTQQGKGQSQPQSQPQPTGGQ